MRRNRLISTPAILNPAPLNHVSFGTEERYLARHRSSFVFWIDFFISDVTAETIAKPLGGRRPALRGWQGARHARIGNLEYPS
jgi:hypothetical protein